MKTEGVLANKNREELLEILRAKETVITNQNKTIQALYEQLRLNRHKRFGSQSEKDLDGATQCSLFDEAEIPDNAEEIADADETMTIPEHQRKKKKGRKPLPKNLPREQKVYDLPENEKTCSCGCELSAIGEVVTEQLEIIPAKVYIIEHVRKKYACKNCEETIKQAPMPKHPIPKSIAGPGLLAHTLVSKFQDHLPLYRQEKILQRAGIDIPRATLSLWVIRCAELLSPLTKLLLSYIQDYDVGFMDESTLQVLKEKNRAPQSKSYMWILGGGPPDKFAWVYHYAPSRAHTVPLDLLEDFKGYLHCDGYQAYDSLSVKTGITQVGCWYHARRKFIDAKKVSGKEGLATQAIQFIKKLSKLEEQFTRDKLSAAQRFHQRKNKSKPIIEKFKEWLDTNISKVLPKSLLGEAMSYTLRQWPKLLIYLQDGRLEFSNNRTERAVKPFAIGRKNWLFANSVAGANAAAVIYSLIETCKHHKIDAYQYLRYTLSQIQRCTTSDELELLLPFNIEPSLLSITTTVGL